MPITIEVNLTDKELHAIAKNAVIEKIKEVAISNIEGKILNESTLKNEVYQQVYKHIEAVFKSKKMQELIHDHTALCIEGQVVRQRLKQNLSKTYDKK